MHEGDPMPWEGVWTLWRRLSRGSGMLGSICRASGRDDRRASRREKFQPLREKRRATPIFFPSSRSCLLVSLQSRRRMLQPRVSNTKGSGRRHEVLLSAFVCASAGCVPTLPANPTLDDVKIQTLPLPAAALRCLFDATLFHPSELVAACHYLLHRVAAASTALSQSRGERGRHRDWSGPAARVRGRIRVRGGLEQDLGCTACAFQRVQPRVRAIRSELVPPWYLRSATAPRPPPTLPTACHVVRADSTVTRQSQEGEH